MSAGNKDDSQARKDRSQAGKDISQEIKTLKSKLSKKEKEIKLFKKEQEESKDKYLRLAAEMDNLRKRVEKEKEDHYQYALSEFMKELLVVLDNFERALESEGDENGKSFREGMRLIHKQYMDLLVKKGLRPIELHDKKFDPNLHQAFVTEESEEVEEPVIGEEYQKGYSLHERLIRPALVKVIVPKKGE
ncbi:MAG: nucleotide exchange factor GrpE [Candidatus Aminicenantes bacterium]|nr:nucleotide exchange factor GrpE [Candidatus Aminicenantes bacterium]